jgi:diguanylate cyclase (GGDEF)-like protein
MEAQVVLGVSLLVFMSLGAALFATTRAVTTQSRNRAKADLEAGRAAFDRLLQSRAESSAALTRLVTNLPVFRAVVSDPRVARDPATMDAMTEQYREQLGAEFCVVTDLEGAWISQPGWIAGDAETAAFNRLIDGALTGTAQRDILPIRHRLFLVVVEPVRFADEILGAIAVAYALDDAVAHELASVSNFHVNLVTGTHLSGSSLPDAARAALERALDRAGGRPGAPGVSSSLRELGTERYVEGIFPLTAGSFDAAAHLILLEAWKPTQDFLATLRVQIAAATGVIFVLALGGAVVFSRRTSRPVREIALAAGDIASGNWSRQVPVAGSVEAATMAEAFNAMSASLRATQERLVHDAFHDPLTQLPNRALFMDRLQRAFTRRSRHPEYTFAVLFMDLDRFKTVNDSIGHPAGDRLLLEMAERLRRALRGMDTVSRPSAHSDGDAPHTLARVGGDEFTILLEDLADANDAVRIAERLQKSVAMPIALDRQEVFPSVSIGITVVAPTHRSGDDLIRDADIAMYRAKTTGGACCAVFDASMHRRAVEQLQLETDLRHAIERDEFRLHYEPIVDLRAGRIAGYEALVRWQHPEQGLLSPAVFLPVAEETGLITLIDEWVLRQACLDAKRWQASLPGAWDLSVSVNVSAQGFSQPNFVSRVSRVLRHSTLRPNDLRLEITESAAMKDAERTTAILTELRAIGVRISLDDFGMGYSSLSYLQRFPVDTLKIDRSFVLGLGNNKENREIVRTIVSLGRSLKLDVIAEGAETADQVAYLQQLKCGFCQGYFFSRPLPFDELGGVRTPPVPIPGAMGAMGIRN